MQLQRHRQALGRTYILFWFQQAANFTLPVTFVARGVGDRTRFDLGDSAEQAGLETPLAAGYSVSKRMSTMTGNGTATGIEGIGETWTSIGANDWGGRGWLRCP